MFHTVDGKNPKQPPGMYKTIVNNGILLPYQLVQDDFFHQQYFERMSNGSSKIMIHDIRSKHIHPRKLTWNLKMNL